MSTPPPGEHTTRTPAAAGRRWTHGPADPAIWPDTKRGENPTHKPNPAAPARPSGRACSRAVGV